MVCRDAFSPEAFSKNQTEDCLSFDGNKRKPNNNNLSLVRVFALRLHSNPKLEEKTSKKVNLFISTVKGCKPDQFNDVHMNDPPIVEKILRLEYLFLK